MTDRLAGLEATIRSCLFGYTGSGPVPDAEGDLRELGEIARKQERVVEAATYYLMLVLPSDDEEEQGARDELGAALDDLPALAASPPVTGDFDLRTAARDIQAARRDYGNMDPAGITEIFLGPPEREQEMVIYDEAVTPEILEAQPCFKPSHKVLLSELAAARKALFFCWEASGADTDGAKTVDDIGGADICGLAMNGVARLRDDYDECPTPEDLTAAREEAEETCAMLNADVTAAHEWAEEYKARAARAEAVVESRARGA